MDTEQKPTVFVVNMDFAHYNFRIAVFTNLEAAVDLRRRIVFEDFEYDYKQWHKGFPWEFPPFPAKQEDMTEEMADKFWEHEENGGENFISITEEPIMDHTQEYWRGENE